MITFSDEFFNVYDTLNCGQVFRFYQKGDCYFVFSKDKTARLESKNGVVTIESLDEDYFKNYFDLDRDYGKIVSDVCLCNNQKVVASARKYSGIRILKQDVEEAFFSFLISQNNNIPRIKSTIEKLCARFGKKRDFLGEQFFTFPASCDFAAANIDDLKGAGLGYRAEYIKEAAQKIIDGEIDFSAFSALSTDELKRQLLKIKGVGDKVANCVTLFGFNRGDSFPVDTWIEKIYREDFDGKLSDRVKISRYFLDLFKENSGYAQQYLFYAKREKFI